VPNPFDAYSYKLAKPCADVHRRSHNFGSWRC